MQNFAMIKGNDAWLRVAHQDTSLDQRKECVQLAWHYPDVAQSGESEVVKGGLAVDPWCRVYHTIPEEGRVERLYWDDRLDAESARSLFDEQPFWLGDFQYQSEPLSLLNPGPMAITDTGHLFLADTGVQQIHIFDLLEGKKRRTLYLPHPVCDLCHLRDRVYALIYNELIGEAQILRINTSDTPELLDISLPDYMQSLLPGGIAVDGAGRLFILFNSHEQDACIWATDGKNERINVPFASDLQFVDSNILVVARSPGAEFLRFYIRPGNYEERPPLQALSYDGRGIASGPEEQIIYWGNTGVLSATEVKPKFVNRGRLICFQLDNQQLQRRWGRVFIDACIPPGTQLKLGFIVADDKTLGPTVSPSPPVNLAEYQVLRPDLSPPLPAEHALQQVNVDFDLHRRSQSRELPWSFTEEHWRTYEAPVNAPPGRYLWLVIDVFGKSFSSPKISQIRVEYPSRDLLRHLPRVFAQSVHTSGFLDRYLSLLNSNFDELDKRAENRDVLVNPVSAPNAVLPWLSSLIGMELDWRWSETAKRQILKEAMWLFKYRGTVKGLERFIEIYLQRQVTIIEHYRTRGLGGAFVGESEELASSAILGAGFRIGGKLDEAEQVFLGQQEGEDFQLPDAIKKHAHKFTVIVPLILTSLQRDVIAHILNVHRPAHTLYEICAVDSGMRLGTGLHLGLTSVVGQSSGFGKIQLGNSLLGRTDLLSKAQPGMSVGNSHLGKNSRAG